MRQATRFDISDVCSDCLSASVCCCSCSAKSARSIMRNANVKIDVNKKAIGTHRWQCVGVGSHSEYLDSILAS
jgi:hypothetical protein